jgi:protein SCO1
MKWIIILSLFLYMGCKEKHEHHGHHDHHDHKAIPAKEATEGSLFDLEDTWKTESEKSFIWTQLKGRPFLVSMFYASCQSVCPRIVTDMQIIAKKMEEKTGEKPTVVLISFDPSTDTPQALTTYKKKMELGENWHLLNGSEDSVRTISVLLGISYQKTTGNDFNHSTVISLISDKGNILSRIEGVGANSAPILDKL